MSAATQMRHVSERGGSCCDRAGLGYILAGTEVVSRDCHRRSRQSHDGLSNRRLQQREHRGGRWPLQVAGANANGGLRFIASSRASSTSRQRRAQGRPSRH